MKAFTPSAILPCVLGLVLPIGVSSAQNAGATPFGVRVAKSIAASRAPGKTVKTPTLRIRRKRNAPTRVSSPAVGAHPRGTSGRGGIGRTNRGRSSGIVSRGGGSIHGGGRHAGGRHGVVGRGGRGVVGIGGRVGGTSFRFGIGTPRPACGYWDTVRERYHVPAVYEWRRDSCGRLYRVCVRAACYEWRTRRVWRAGCHARCGCNSRRGRRSGRYGRHRGSLGGYVLR